MKSPPSTAKDKEDKSVMIVMLSNGPGELSTWVKPLAEELHKEIRLKPIDDEAQISLRLVLVPCPNATGKEKYAAEKWGYFDKITTAKIFWKLLIYPQKYGFWPKKGIVIFLGGDQFWSVLLSARLRYLNMTYAEWIARWPQWNDKTFAMSKNVKKQIPKYLRSRCTVVGDLMADIGNDAKKVGPLSPGQWIALLPGSKKAKLVIGIPFFLELADKISKIMPTIKFLIPLAPTTNINELINLSGKNNPISKKYKSGIKEIKLEEEKQLRYKLITTNDTEICLFTSYPAHDYLSQCNLAITTVGANTAELAALTTPMIVVIPTQHLNVMEAWDGLLGIVGRVPFFKRLFGIIISLWRLRKKRFMAWPNISAGRMIVPERIGTIYPKEIADEAVKYLKNPVFLDKQKKELQLLRGEHGAIKKIVKELINTIKQLR